MAVVIAVTDIAVVADIDVAGEGRRALPPLFIEQIQSYDIPEYAGLLDALASGSPAIAVRANRSKGIDLIPELAPVLWNGYAGYLRERPRFTFDPAFHQGLYYVQEPSSMIVGEVVRRLSASMDRPLYLDACAAPGGKTTAAIDALPDGAFVVANEYVPARAAVLRDNLIKWGCPRVAVSRGDTVAFRKLNGLFDIVATDVPCSGEGMMRKEPEALAQWSPSLVRQCAALQREIVENVWPSLRPGGYLIYSTCTFNREENDRNVDWIVSELGAEPVSVEFPDSWGIVSDGCMHRFMPHRLNGEGLFMAVLRKPDSESGGRRNLKVKPAKNVRQDPVLKKAEDMLRPDMQVTLTLKNDMINALPSDCVAIVNRLSQALNLIYSGVDVAAVKGRDIIPTHALALSVMMADDAFARAEVDYVTAIAYLRRDAVNLPDGLPRGLLLLTYAGRPLGFVKNLGNRTNSMMPQEWRILSSHVPDTPPVKLVI